LVRKRRKRLTFFFPKLILENSISDRLRHKSFDSSHNFLLFRYSWENPYENDFTGRHPSQGTILKATQFLRNELPVRLAHRVVELEKLPHSLSTMPSVIKVKEWYTKSFEDLINFGLENEPKLPKEFWEKTSNNGNAGNRYVT